MAIPPHRTDHRARLKATAATATAATLGVTGLLAGCSSGSDTDKAAGGVSTTAATGATAAPTTAAPTTAAATAAAPTTAAPATTAAGSLPATPAGAQQLQTEDENGATYWRYSISGTTAAQVVADYQSSLQGAGYSVQDSGSGGGGWGKWGGAGAGLTGQDGGTYVSVQAGGESSGPTYFEVCQGPSSQSVNDCENASDGPQDSNSGGS